MKIYMGPYLDYWGPYQIARLLKHVGISKDDCDSIGEYLSNTWVQDVCNYVDSFRERSIKIKIKNYDTWNLDDTLSKIIVPCLKQLKEQKHGVPLLSADELKELPEELRNLEKTEENEYEVMEKQWNFIMDEMIWSFENVDEGDEWWGDSYTPEKYEALCERRARGLKWFGIYFMSLWD